MKPIEVTMPEHAHLIDRIFLGLFPKWMLSFLGPVVIILTILVSMFFQRYELSGESWGYWSFAQILIDKGTFVHPDRSPIACLYLAPFLLFPYPFNVDIEYFVSSAIFSLSLYTFLNRYGILFAIVTTSLIYLRTFYLEPFTQHLALASILIAVNYRLSCRYNPLMFYSLLTIAYLFRGTFAFAIFLFLIYDVVRMLRSRESKKVSEFKSNFSGIFSFKYLILPLLLLLFLVLCHTRQSDHPWNNVWLTDVDWIPTGSSSLLNSGMIGHFNWDVAKLLHEEDNKDIYFTHQKFFDNQTSFLKIIAAHPKFYFAFLTENIERMNLSFNQLLGPSWLLLNPGQYGEDSVFPNLVLFSLFIIVGILSCYSMSRIFEIEIRILSASLILTTITILFVYPKDRYLCHHLLVVVLGIVAMAKLGNFASESRIGGQRLLMLGPVFAYAFVFASIAKDYRFLMFEARSSHKQGLHLRQVRYGLSMKESYTSLRNGLSGCRSVLSLEHNFFAAFFFDRQLHSYSVFEIPPFGTYTHSSYKGLNPQRVDCLAISNDLEQAEGLGTTIKSRYRNFIQPYESDLVGKGGQILQIPGWGRIVKLQQTKTRI